MNEDNHCTYVLKFTGWFVPEHPFSLNYLMKCQGLGFHDSEEVISDVYVKCTKPEAAPLKKFDRGMLVTILRNGSRDFFRKWNTDKRKYEKSACCIHELENCKVASPNNTDSDLILRDDLKFAALLIGSAKDKLSEQEQLVGEKWLEMLAQGCDDIRLLPDFFSLEERHLLMDGLENNWKNYRSRVQKIRRKIVETVRTLGRAQDGHWLN